MKKITVDLSSAGIDKMLKEIEKYEKFLKERTDIFCKRLAEEGMSIARTRFSYAQYDGNNDVEVTIEKRNESHYAVVATGSAVLFIEFGTGIFYSSTHADPVASEYPRGSWSDNATLGGKGHWDDPKGWWFKQDATSKKYTHTRGNHANASLYWTKEELRDKIKQIAEEVFNYD